MSNATTADLYREHISHLSDLYARGLEVLQRSGLTAESVLLHSGIAQHYYGDDRGISFQAFGHFLHWLHSNRPDQFLLIRPGQKARYFQVVPPDYWYEQDIQNDPLWHDNIELHRLESVEQLPGLLPAERLVYCGPSAARATALGLQESHINPTALLHFLDYHRACKSEYELVQLREACRLALVGHRAAQECFLAGGSEYDIHMSYLGACKLLEDETPYTNIIALDEKSAILHYQNKRRVSGGDSKVLLIDAGHRVRGYGSDITRTTVRESAHPAFQSLHDGMDSLQQALVAEVGPDRSYVEIHLSALHRLGELLLSLDICHGSLEQLIGQQIPQLFMPHGVGHLLGVQVHDCGGHLRNESGDLLSPPDHSPMLRNTRMMARNMVLTIEPGCYFIPLVLEPVRGTERGNSINWSLVDQLYPLGGIRIEDNVRVLEDGVENLTRTPHG